MTPLPPSAHLHPHHVALRLLVLACTAALLATLGVALARPAAATTAHPAATHPVSR